MDKQVTVLEGIIQDVAIALFQKWANAIPEEQRTQEQIESLSKNASDSAFFVIQMFMDKFNEAAEALKNEPSID
jgi:hypothetical protein